MRVLKVLCMLAVTGFLVCAVLLVQAGLELNDMTSRCNDNSSPKYSPDYEARKAYCGKNGASKADPLPQGH
jgi:hypothetical protein